MSPIGTDGLSPFFLGAGGKAALSALRWNRLGSGASAIAAGTDFFPSARPMMKAGRLYLFWYTLMFTKNTAGTVTFQLKNSAAVNFTALVADMRVMPLGGVLAALGNVSSVLASAAATATFTATQSLSAANHLAKIEGYCIPASDTRLSVAPSAYGAGTITTINGSLQAIADLGSAGVGDFA
jgi:hypothetical protein